jgi:hypothetical protein
MVSGMSARVRTFQSLVGWVIAASLCACSGAQIWAQGQSGTPQPATPAASQVKVGSQDTPAKTPMSPAQKELADDTAKLLTLANELKVEMDKSTKDTLSLSVVRKAEQVEKLAHKVRDEMRKALGN